MFGYFNEDIDVYGEEKRRQNYYEQVRAIQNCPSDPWLMGLLGQVSQSITPTANKKLLLLTKV